MKKINAKLLLFGAFLLLLVSLPVPVAAAAETTVGISFDDYTISPGDTARGTMYINNEPGTIAMNPRVIITSPSSAPVTLLKNEADLYVTSPYMVKLGSSFANVNDGDEHKKITITLGGATPMTAGGNLDAVKFAVQADSTLANYTTVVFDVDDKKSSKFVQTGQWQYSNSFTDVKTDFTININPATLVITDTVTVNFDTKGGNAMSPRTITGGNVPAFGIPTRTGYTFTGWYLDDACTLNVTDASGSGIANAVNATGWKYTDADKKWLPIKGTHTLYAGWEPGYSILTFNSDGGSSIANDKIFYDQSTLVTKTADEIKPTKPGNTFLGWYIGTQKIFNDDGTLISGTASPYVSGGVWKYTSPVTLTAKWEPITATITLNKDGSTFKTTTVGCGDYATKPTGSALLAAKTGYTTEGWYLDGAAAPHDAAAKLIDNTGALVNSVSYGGNAYTDAAGKWVYNEDGILPKTLTAYLNWTPITYNVRFNGNGATSGSMPDQVFTYDVIQNLDANTFVKTGYTFDGWAETPTGAVKFTNGASVTTNLASTQGAVKNLYAKWTPITYNVSFSINGGSGGTMANQKITYDVSTALTANNFTHTTMGFAGWDTSSSGTTAVYADKGNVINLSSTQGATVPLYAVWKPKYDIAFNNTTGTGIMANQTFVETVPQALTANTFTKSGYYFNGWAKTYSDAMNGTVLYTNKQTITVDAPATLYAVWKLTPAPEPTQVSTIKTGGSGGTGDTGSGHYTYYERLLSKEDSVSFGSSQIVYSITFSEPVSGAVTLNYDTKGIIDTIRTTIDPATNKTMVAAQKEAPVLYSNKTGAEYEFWYIFKIDGTAKLPTDKVNNIYFKIPLSELKAAGFDETDVVLYHGDDKAEVWTPLDTYLEKSDKSYVYYRAETNGAYPSPFAILFIEDKTIIPVQTTQTVAPTVIKTEKPAATSKPTTLPTTAPTETKSPAPVAGLLAGLGLAGLILGARRS